MTEEERDKTLLRLALAVERAFQNPGFLIWRGFLIGLASGAGGVLGAALIIIVLGLIVGATGGIPFIGQFFGNIFNVVDPNGV